VFKTQDVKYELEQRGPVPVGSEFTVIVRTQNSSRFERTVNMTLTIFAVNYTGLSRTKLRGEIFNFNLCSLRRTLRYVSLLFLLARWYAHCCHMGTAKASYARPG